MDICQIGSHSWIVTHISQYERGNLSNQCFCMFIFDDDKGVPRSQYCEKSDIYKHCD